MSTAQPEWSRQIMARAGKDAEGWDYCDGLSKIDAERLLDWLEAHGCTQREAAYVDGQGFTVRWRGLV